VRPTEELLGWVGRLHDHLQLKTVRITGGEPTIHPGLHQIVSGLLAMGVPDIRMTTNGHRMRQLAESLAGSLTSVNISLDAISSDVFAKMSRGREARPTLDGIVAAVEAGIPTKLNCVVLRGMNDDEIIPVARFARSLGVTVRFLEVMSMGPLYQQSQKLLVTEKEIVDRLSDVFGEATLLPREAHSTTRYYATTDGLSFGIIANHSAPFCSDCNRLRLDSHGNLYGCLSATKSINLSQIAGEEDLDEALRFALAQKQTRFTGSTLNMKSIGG